MKKPNFKLGSIKNMLTKDEMKSIAGGYNVCCCVGGNTSAANLDSNHSWSGCIGCTDCANWCYVYGMGATGGQWDSTSLCNYWQHHR